VSRNKKSSTNTALVELFGKTSCWNCRAKSLLKWLNLCWGKLTPLFLICQGKKAWVNLMKFDDEI
jgi:hypothetical protein